MSINAATSSTSVSSSSNVTNSAASSEVAKKSSSESSFKDEMNKVSSTETKKEDKKTESTKSEKSEKFENNEKSEQVEPSVANIEQVAVQNPANIQLEANADYSNFASISMMDVNTMLSNDIEQMINNTQNIQLDVLGQVSELSKSAGMLTLDFTNKVSVSQSDAEFFVNLTQNNDISLQNITTQAQVMLNQGTDVKEVQQNVRISETLLNAINNAKETNQPLRIDFDQNVSVILRIGKDGAIAANFIPGDKVVEQYLKNNIEFLKKTFDENDLPYSDLSYSNRGSKQQKQKRNNQQ